MLTFQGLPPTTTSWRSLIWCLTPLAAPNTPKPEVHIPFFKTLCRWLYHHTQNSVVASVGAPPKHESHKRGLLQLHFSVLDIVKQLLNWNGFIVCWHSFIGIHIQPIRLIDRSIKGKYRCFPRDQCLFNFNDDNNNFKGFGICHCIGELCEYSFAYPLQLGYMWNNSNPNLVEPLQDLMKLSI